jgi:hypothetical protein
VARFPPPESWPDILEAVKLLTEDQRGFKTFVLDTVDWAEPMLWAYMIKRDSRPDRKLESIEDYGYGKGYQAALDEWRVLLKLLEGLYAKGVNVILIGHSQTKAYKNPEGDDYDRFELAVHLKAGGLLKQWADHVLFARFETYANKDKVTKRVRGVSTGARVIHTVRTAAFDAKHRGSLPETLPLSWADFVSALEAGQPADPNALREEILRKAAQLGGETETKTLAYLEANSGDPAKMAVLNNRLNALLSEKGSV